MITVEQAIEALKDTNYPTEELVIRQTDSSYEVYTRYFDSIAGFVLEYKFSVKKE